MLLPLWRVLPDKNDCVVVGYWWSLPPGFPSVISPGCGCQRIFFLTFPVRILLSLFLRGIQTPPKFVSFLRDYSSKGASLVAQMLKNLPAMQKTQFLFSPREEHGNPPQYSCLENPMDRGTWQATVHGVAKIGHEWATNTFSLTRETLSFVT